MKIIGILLVIAFFVGWYYMEGRAIRKNECQKLAVEIAKMAGSSTVGLYEFKDETYTYIAAITAKTNGYVSPSNAVAYVELARWGIEKERKDAISKACDAMIMAGYTEAVNHSEMTWAEFKHHSFLEHLEWERRHY